ncbi:secretion protein EspA [Chitinimonas sp. BJB300]|nr:secretion protein EspA [Chitinimonas sp. BJB300]TSJ88655.1 secretion protein EspA [Chitinimonas sp. BJB300]
MLVNTATPGLGSVGDYGNFLNNKAGSGDSIISGGIEVLYKFMTLFSDLAQGKYDQMSVKADRSRNSQEAANQVDSKIAEIDDPKKGADLPDVVIKYMREHNITVMGKSIDDYLDSIGHKDGKGLKKGDLDSIKGALESDSGRCSDFVSQAQLQIQKVMQSYNVCVSLINSMQTLLAEMCNKIAQNIR